MFHLSLHKLELAMFVSQYSSKTVKSLSVYFELMLLLSLCLNNINDFFLESYYALRMYRRNISSVEIFLDLRKWQYSDILNKTDAYFNPNRLDLALLKSSQPFFQLPN